jgi:hypothetical protein
MQYIIGVSRSVFYALLCLGHVWSSYSVENVDSVADHYLLFDFPGQVELFFLHSNAKNVIMKLIKKLSLRVCFNLQGFHIILIC